MPDLYGNPPLNLRAEDVGDGVSVRLRWDDTGDDYWRIYWTAGSYFDSITETSRTTATISGVALGSVVRVEGVPSGIYEEVAVNPTLQNNPLLAAYQLRPIENYQIAPGDSVTLELADYIAPASYMGVPASWASLTVESEALGGAVALTQSGTQLVLSAPAGATPSEEQTIVLVRISRSGYAPCWVAFCASVGLATRALTRSLPAFLLDELPDRIQVPCGVADRVVSQDSWKDALVRRVGLLGLRLEDGEFRVLAPEERGTAHVAVVRGSLGYSVVTVNAEYLVGDGRTRPPILPRVPSGTFKAEKGGLWVNVDASAWLSSERALRESRQWQRVFLGTEGASGELYDVSLYKEPASVHYDAPATFRGVWLDRELFPEDARLTSGRVVYRGGLESPPAQEATPDITGLRVTPGPDSAVVQWNASYRGRSVRVDLPVYARPLGRTETVQRGGTSPVTIEGLTPATDYEVWLLHADPDQARSRGLLVQTRTLRAPVVARAFVTRTGEKTWRVVLEVPQRDSDPWTRWHNPITDEWTGEERLELTTNADIEQLSIVVDFGGELVTSEVEVLHRWPERLTLRRRVPIGYRMRAEGETPRFYRVRYGDRAVWRMPPNLLRPGRWEYVIDGYLPVGMEGSLHDYVRVVLELPDGRELELPAALEVAAQVVPRVEVTGDGERSPVVYGVRLLNFRSPS